MLNHKLTAPTLSSCTCSLKDNNGRQKNSIVAEVWQAQEEYSLAVLPVKILVGML
jgi:hypothetical protein